MQIQDFLTQTATDMSQTQLPYGPQWWWLSRSGVSDSCDPVDCSPPRPLPMGFFRQEHWSGVPFPSPGDLRDPGIEPRSPALLADDLPTEL